MPVDLVAGESSEVKLEMHRHGESASDLANAIAKNGSATVYGLEFDFNKATLKPGSETALNAILSLIKGQPAVVGTLPAIRIIRGERITT